MQSQPCGVFWYADWTDPLPTHHVLLDRHLRQLATAEVCHYLPDPERPNPWCGGGRPLVNPPAGQNSHTALQAGPHSRRALVTVLDHNNNNSTSTGPQVDDPRDNNRSQATHKSRQV